MQQAKSTHGDHEHYAVSTGSIRVQVEPAIILIPGIKLGTGDPLVQIPVLYYRQALLEKGPALVFQAYFIQKMELLWSEQPSSP